MGNIYLLGDRPTLPMPDDAKLIDQLKKFAKGRAGTGEAVTAESPDFTIVADVKLIAAVDTGQWPPIAGKPITMSVLFRDKVNVAKFYFLEADFSGPQKGTTRPDQIYKQFLAGSNKDPYWEYSQGAYKFAIDWRHVEYVAISI